MGLLDGKVAVVTGAGRGVGRAHAMYLAAAGAKVVVNDLGGERDGSGKDTKCADEVVEEIKKAGGEAVPNYDNVAEMAGGAAIVKTAVDAFGRLDIAVNNAGILRDKTLMKMEEAMWDAVMAVHVKGTFIVSQAAAKQMVEQGEGGRIINTSSTSGLIGNFGQSNYGAAKAGIMGFTRVLAIELKRKDITVNAIAPNAWTRMTDDLGFDGMKAMLPEHNSPIVVYLASDLSADITGKAFIIYGNRITEFQCHVTPGAVKEDGEWTAMEIASRIDEIMKLELPAS